MYVCIHLQACLFTKWVLKRLIKGQGQGQNLGRFNTFTKTEAISFCISSSRFITAKLYNSKSKVKVKVINALKLNISVTLGGIKVIFSVNDTYAPLEIKCIKDRSNIKIFEKVNVIARSFQGQQIIWFSSMYVYNPPRLSFRWMTVPSPPL